MSDFEALDLHIDGHVAKIEFNRPQRGNAFDAVLHAEFPKALHRVDAASNVRVLLLTAAGTAFSAGGDFDYITALRQDDALREAAFREGVDLFDRMTNLRVPIVAAVHGHAIGLGATIAAMCDIVVAWRDARIADPHVTIGLAAGDGGVIAWTAAIGYNRARRHLLTGDALTGAQAFDFGLVTDLAETPDQTRELARTIAVRIAALPPLAVQGTRRAFRALAEVRNGTAQQAAFATERQTLTSSDLAEAMLAAHERRPGRYTNN